MKRTITITILVFAALWQADQILLFLIGGFIPGTSLRVEPSTNLAIITATLIMIPILRSRRKIISYSVKQVRGFKTRTLQRLSAS